MMINRHIRGAYRVLLFVTATLLALPAAGILASPVATERDAAQAGEIEISFEPVITGVVSPMFMAEAPDGSGRMFVVSKAGIVRVAAGGTLLDQPFLDISDIVNDEFDEAGLFSIAFHPDFASNGLFLVAFTRVDGTNSVMRFQVSANDPNRADPESGVTLLAIPDRVPQFHNGGGLAFGPDGYLYVSTGDEGLTYDRDGNAQSLLSLHGKILRIDPVTGPVAEGEPAYAIPPDNPFAGRDDALPEIWAYGLRNPWRFSFDRETGDLWVADVGQDTWEEVNFQPAGSPGGENYGWNLMEGSHCFPPDSECDPTGLTLPVAEYSHDEGCAVIGGYVYRGRESPALAGTYLFADICSGNIWGLRRDAAGEWQQQLLGTTDLTITSFAQDLTGEVYITTFESGAVRRIVATTNEPVELPAFQDTWARTDQPVASGEVARSWIWGPWETRTARIEPYAEAPGGQRTVIYFDKARMEITDPEGDADSPWYVTNGLLVTEMITGQVQLGHALFQQREPADISVAGDPDSATGAAQASSPTYATFAGLLDSPPHPFDRPIIQQLDRDGNVTSNDALAAYGVTIAAIDDVTGHAIAGPFWGFMNAEGPVMVDGELQTGPLFPDPVFATGRPITEAYWSSVRVAGVEKLVLIQCFERRCLTYTPDNPEGWQVEAGNVGRHYYTWRYGD